MSATAEKGMEVNLATLSIEQLKQFHGQCGQEIQILQQSLSNLKMVQSSFMSSETSLDQLKSVEENKEILVPLTGSLYVPGKLIRNQKVMVDIGTGYYIQKNIDDAKKYFDKKIKFMTKQMEGLTPILQQKMQIRDDVMEVMQYKVQMQQQVAKAAAAGGQPAAQ